MRYGLLSSALIWIAYGQPGTPPAFEVASVKQAAAPSNMPARPSVRGGPGTSDPERIAFIDVTLASVVLRAYDVKSFQLIGPDWLSSQRYDIIAKIPPGTTKEQLSLMLQGLLAERFHLVLRHEIRQLRGYELVRGKTGAKLKRSTEVGSNVEPTEAPRTDANGFPRLSAPGLVLMEGVRGTAVVSFLTARAQPLSALADFLSKEFRLPITDKTGRTGKFDFALEFAPETPGALPPESPDGSGSNLVSAVPRQLGLKLEPSNIPVDMLIVDSADKIPTEN